MSGISCVPAFTWHLSHTCAAAASSRDCSRRRTKRCLICIHLNRLLNTADQRARTKLCKTLCGIWLHVLAAGRDLRPMRGSLAAPVLSATPVLRLLWCLFKMPGRLFCHCSSWGESRSCFVLSVSRVLCPLLLCAQLTKPRAAAARLGDVAGSCSRSFFFFFTFSYSCSCSDFEL